jgi:hypothetical protein
VNLSALIQNLKQLDEITLLEVLDLHADEIVEKFKAEIEERFEELRWKVEGPAAPLLRTDERYEPLTGHLSWKSDKEASDFDPDNE